jgi:hypothetical protein
VRTKTVAIVTPLPPRVELLPEEKLSMRHLHHFLGRYDKYLVVPAGTSVRYDGFEPKPFPRKFFGSLAAHNQLLMWPKFYRAFAAYEYILIYHLDSLVFSDELMRWCEAGWDYIGAPWLPCEDMPWVGEAQVGNGGFTLMKLSSVLQVLENRHRQKPITYWSDLLLRNTRLTRPLFRTLERMQPWVRLQALDSVVAHWQRSQNPAVFGCSNDVFWSCEAEQYLPSFRIAPVEEGLRFAFEGAPRLCFELNQQRLPFGCHAWTKFDRGFWEPHLLPAA